MAFDPQIACENLKEWGAVQENPSRSKGSIFRKNDRYLVVHDGKRDVVVSINDHSASRSAWATLPEDFRTEVLKQEGSGKAVVKQYLGKNGDGILVLKFSNAHDMKTVFDWYTK